MCRNFVAYYRVSTAKQGASGLGLEAQEAAATAFIAGKRVRSEEHTSELQSP